MILAIDFDGVIHDHLSPVEGRRMGLPIKGAKVALMRLKGRNDTIIIHTVRGGRPVHVAAWLEYYDIPYDSITNIKPDADVYLDDRAIRFESWDTTKI